MAANSWANRSCILCMRTLFLRLPKEQVMKRRGGRRRSSLRGKRGVPLPGPLLREEREIKHWPNGEEREIKRSLLKMEGQRERLSRRSNFRLGRTELSIFWIRGLIRSRRGFGEYSIT